MEFPHTLVATSLAADLFCLVAAFCVLEEPCKVPSEPFLDVHPLNVLHYDPRSWQALNYRKHGSMLCGLAPHTFGR